MFANAVLINKAQDKRCGHMHRCLGLVALMTEELLPLEQIGCPFIQEAANPQDGVPLVSLPRIKVLRRVLAEVVVLPCVTLSFVRELLGRHQAAFMPASDRRMGARPNKAKALPRARYPGHTVAVEAVGAPPHNLPVSVSPRDYQDVSHALSFYAEAPDKPRRTYQWCCRGAQRNRCKSRRPTRQ